MYVLIVMLSDGHLRQLEEQFAVQMGKMETYSTSFLLHFPLCYMICLHGMLPQICLRQLAYHQQLYAVFENTYGSIIVHFKWHLQE